ncbi:Golgi-associated plant pathogenesis-related protein 1 [Orchesella cincta]|uniref:Golgi-associated plant pathogenesis-related protein 1 n=1 Tax=Orchesella cincta TaxID=48709 RepID=A0A1D2N209_ORCCI|nr:Golgi-associated plant pathogenesis-related protein 1 [Orchesella cincta]
MSFNQIFIMSCVATAALLQSEVVNAQEEEEYHLLALDLSNEARAMHHVGPLFMSDELNQMAQMCAQWYADQGGWFNHPNNIAHTCPFRGDAGEKKQYARELWYAEVDKYKFNGDFDVNSGHFTQMVWAASRLFGFGLSSNTNGVVVGVALYTPKGNILTQFQQNVFPA